MIEAAQDAFTRSILKFIQRQKRRLTSAGSESPSFCNLEYHVLYLTCHITLVLEQLNSKRQSLECAIEAFDGLSSSCSEVIQTLFSKVSESNDREKFTHSLREALQHWFIQYLRLRDSFVLLTSGECRHPNDSMKARVAKKNGYCDQKIAVFLRELNDNEISSYLSVISKIRSSFSFPSELDVDPANTRKDGYTKLFKSKNGYSGFGWDELFNDELGLRYRLLFLLYQMTIFPKSSENIPSHKIKSTLDRIWEESLIEKGGAYSFDIAFDEHERRMQHLQKTFEERCDSFIGVVNRVLQETSNSRFVDFNKQLSSQVFMHQSKRKQGPSGKLILSKEDKFERLELKEASTCGLSELIIQRQGDAFKVIDDHGVLPSNMTVSKWLSAMKLPNSLLSVSSQIESKKLKKFRRIKDEDSGSDLRTKSTSSLKIVVVEAPTPCEKLNKFDESIGDIKKQCGVDSVGLERSREELEAEENGLQETRLGSLKHLESTNALTDDITETEGMIMNERERVEMLKRVLQRVSDLDEIWDARESLRESFMFLGNRLLSLHELLMGNGNRSILFEAASCFQEALRILKSLRKIVDRCYEKSVKEHIDFVKRTLILCRGRALANLGRTFLEQFKQRSNNLSQRINEAIRCFNEATSCAHALRAQSVCSLTSKDDQYTVFLAIHKYEADELESFAGRWLGICVWQSGSKERAIDILSKAMGNRDKLTISKMIPTNVLHAEMKCQIEEYYGASSLINLTTKEVDTVLLTPDNVNHYNELVTISSHAYERAAGISDSLFSVARSRADCPITRNDLIQEHDIASSEDLQQMRDIFLDTWEEKKSFISSKISYNHDNRNDDRTRLPRNDIFPNGFMPSNKRTFIQSEKIVHKDRQKSKGHAEAILSKEVAHKPRDDAFDGFGVQTQVYVPTPLDSNAVKRKITYMRWGDEVLISMGKDIHRYPSCCPERSPMYSAEVN